MEDARLKHLFGLLVEGRASSDELEELRHLMADKQHEDQTKQLIDSAWKDFTPQHGVFNQTDSREILKTILRPAAPIRKFGFFKKAVAAALLIFAASFFYYLVRKADSRTSDVASHNERVQQVLPGGDRALLTLSDGTVIDLDSMASGKIAINSLLSITKTIDGKIIYDPSAATDDGAARSQVNAFNTMSTPRGGQYRLRLPDGSDVWLNAASSIRYPLAFAGDERRVEITGEVYFEVAKKPASRFRVITNGTEITVYGTHFNVNAYADEAVVQTTLVEGSVKVSHGNASVMLKPGQQANVDEQNRLAVIEDADVEESLGWKDGYFIFRGTNIKHIMRQVSRWYNVDVEYQLPTDDLAFSGVVSRKDHVSEILKIMELTGLVNFKIQGNKIIVTK